MPFLYIIHYRYSFPSNFYLIILLFSYVCWQYSSFLFTCLLKILFAPVHLLPSFTSLLYVLFPFCLIFFLSTFLSRIGYSHLLPWFPTCCFLFFFSSFFFFYLHSFVCSFSAITLTLVLLCFPSIPALYLVFFFSLYIFISNSNNCFTFTLYIR